MRSWTVGLMIMLALAGLGGCATSTNGTGESNNAPLDTNEPVRHQVNNQAVEVLWQKAQKARADDRLGDASTALERALRMAPQDAVLWSRLAEIRLRQRRFAVAENLAAKSNSLSDSNRLLRYRNWLLIAEARKRRDDDEGAQKARVQAQSLRDGDDSDS